MVKFYIDREEVYEIIKARILDVLSAAKEVKMDDYSKMRKEIYELKAYCVSTVNEEEGDDA